MDTYLNDVGDILMLCDEFNFSKDLQPFNVGTKHQKKLKMKPPALTGIK
jgi:hypothetical protein